MLQRTRHVLVDEGVRLLKSSILDMMDHAKRSFSGASWEGSDGIVDVKSATNDEKSMWILWRDP